MNNAAWSQGCDDAAAAFGLAKQASAAQWVKQMLVGQPSRYFDELKSGKLFSRGGLLSESLDPRVSSGPAWARAPLSAANAALLYGLPLYSLYSATKAPPEQRGSAAGSTLGSIVGGTLGAPLGIAGSLAGTVLGSSLGEGVGRLFNRSTPPKRISSSDASE